MKDLTILLFEPNCKRTTAEQKRAVAKYIEDMINSSHTSEQRKELQIPKSWKSPFSIKVHEVKMKNCFIYIKARLSKDMNDQVANQFLNRFKKSANLEQIRPVPEIISQINFESMGLKIELSKTHFQSWNWPANVVS